MPETSIVFDHQDENRLVAAILREGCRIVAMRQQKLQPEEICDLDSFLIKRQSERFFCVVHECYQQEPIHLARASARYYEGTYDVDQRVGGPTIDFLLCAQYETNGKQWISDGSIGYYKTYKSLITGEYKPTPESLVRCYKTIVKDVKLGGKVIKGNSGRKWLIGSHALRCLKEGALHWNIEGLKVDWQTV